MSDLFFKRSIFYPNDASPWKEALWLKHLLKVLPYRNDRLLGIEGRRGNGSGHGYRGLLLLLLLSLGLSVHFGCAEPLGYLKIQFLSEDSPPYDSTTNAASFTSYADFNTDASVYLRWRGPSTGSLVVPVEAHRAEIRSLPPGFYSVDVTVGAQGKTLFATTIQAEVRAGEITPITIPLGGNL